MITPPPSPCRRGTILIVVSGISALMASLTLAFLVNAQADSRESELQIRDGQARIMLVAACSYLLEASRIGWEPMKPTDPSGLIAPEPASTEHLEAFGWIDVRDGSLGPHINTLPITDADRLASVDANGNPYPVNKMVSNPFPVGVPARFPMHVLNRPPFAISPRVAWNPIDPAVPRTQHLQNRDPEPADNVRNEWAKGETHPGVGPDGKLQYKVRQNSIGQSWFRILREKSGASFIVTCGAGGTLGYRDWAEIDVVDKAYFGDRSFFEALRESEIRLWYRVEWNAAVVAMEMNYLREGMEHAWKLSSFSYSGGGHDMGDSSPTVGDSPGRGNYSSQWMSTNMGGSIQYIQRLRQEPTAW